MERESIRNIMNELGINRETFYKYVYNVGYQLQPFQEDLEEKVAKEIRKFHGFATTHPEFIWEQYRYLDENKFESSPFVEEIVTTIKADNLIQHKEKLQLNFNAEKFTSDLTNFEACSICLGLDNRRARFIAREFLNKSKHDFLDEIHYYAIKTKEKYSHEMVSYLLSLPPLPFKITEFEEVFSELDKKLTLKKFPSFRLLFHNKNNGTEKIVLSFYSKMNKGLSQMNKDLIQIKNATTGKAIFYINRRGVLFPAENPKEIIPIIKLFFRFNKESNTMIINYGLQTGECSDCGRELTDPLSIQLGRGPICRRQ